MGKGWCVEIGILIFSRQIPHTEVVAHHTDNQPIKHIVMQPRVLALLGACFLMSVAHGHSTRFIPFISVEHGYAKSAIGGLWAIGVICEIAVFLVMPSLVNRYGYTRILLVSFAAAVARFLMIAWCVDILVILLMAQVLHAATFGAYHAASVGLIHEFFKGRHQSKGQALFGSFSYGAGGMVGGLSSRSIWQHYGASVLFSASALMALLGMGLMVWILRAANNVIGPNPKLYPKTLFSELGEGEPVRVVDADNEEHEAERAVARIQSLRAEGLVDSQGKQYKEFRDFAVLYRANHQAKPFEKALRKAGIPYKVSGGQSFFDRAEIRDLCAWFRLWSNNDDDPAFLRAVTTPKRGIGHTTLGTLGVYASQYKLSLFESLFSSSLAAALSAKALGSLHEFGRYINDLEFRARHTEGAEAATALYAGMAQRNWLRKAPLRRRRQREGGRRQVDQRAGVLRLDGAALRRAD